MPTCCKHEKSSSPLWPAEEVPVVAEISYGRRRAVAKLVPAISSMDSDITVSHFNTRSPPRSWAGAFKLVGLNGLPFNPFHLRFKFRIALIIAGTATLS